MPQDKKYLKELAAHDLLSEEQEILYSKKIMARKDALIKIEDESLTEEQIQELENIINEGEQARTQFISSNYRLVLNIAQTIISTKLSPTDIVNEGILGLVTAVDNYDYTYGNRFSTYAFLYIKGSIRRAVFSIEHILTIPETFMKRKTKLKKTIDEFTEINGYEPSMDDLVILTEYSYAEVVDIYNYPTTITITNEEMDIYNPYYQEDDLEYPERKALEEEIDSLLTPLNEREKRIVKLRHGFFSHQDYSFREIAEVVGGNETSVRKAYHRSIEKIRKIIDDIE